MLIAQITDMHVKAPGHPAYGRVDTGGYLRRCVDHLNSLQPAPQLVFATGDLVHAGAPEEYAHCRELLAQLRMPCYLLTGNHDDRAGIREAFPGHTYLPQEDEFLHYVVEQGPLRFICLDTLVPGEPWGLMCRERLDWLAERLAEAPSQPTVILMHHPPVSIGIAFMDGHGLDGADAMAEVVAAHSQVQRVLCGHIHRPIQALWAKTMVSVAPSPAHQVVLDLEDRLPGSFIMEPPACHLHFWMPPTGLLTHLSYIGDFDGPHPFRKPVEAAK
ncbi:MAG: phosphodiesterase [SAR324 cluster bacterium]|nr:phosphodiesterase [SAR324 cluster bacterium]